jgi:hypothetical protein
MCPVSTRHEDTKKREKIGKLRKWFLGRREAGGLPPALWRLVDKEELWGRLDKEGYIDQVLDLNDSYEREDLLYEAAEIVRAEVGGAAGALGLDLAQRPVVIGGGEDQEPRRRDDRNVGGLAFGDSVGQRAEAFTWYLLKLAAEDSGVKLFRQRVLNGDTVSYDEALALVDSPAAAVFSCDWFEERNIPLVGHKAQLLEGDWPPSEGSAQVRGTIRIEWHGGELLAPFEGVAPFRAQEVLLFTKEHLHRRPGLVVLEDSVLGVLLRLAHHLSERFSWWGPQWMPNFVLTGRAPLVAWYETHYYRKNLARYGRDGKKISQPRLYTPITIEVPPWYSVEMVSQIYRGIKEKLPTTPMPSERRLALFEFVMKQPEVKVTIEGQIPKVPWVKLMRSWNETSLAKERGWRYDYEHGRGNFRRDFCKAFELIANYYR